MKIKNFSTQDYESQHSISMSIGSVWLYVHNVINMCNSESSSCI
jgi:hypothetical protein